jgi:glycine cleavage system H protein
MEYPGDLKYTKDHEWIKVEGDTVTVGITAFAQDELGEIVFIELPDVGSDIGVSDSLCVVESTKAASDVYAPLSGKVSAVNEALQDQPDLVNSSPYADGWMVKLSGVSEEEVAKLLTVEQYKELVG